MVGPGVSIRSAVTFLVNNEIAEVELLAPAKTFDNGSFLTSLLYVYDASLYVFDLGTWFSYGCDADS